MRIVPGGVVTARPSTSVQLAARTHDPDGDRVATSWWQYREEGTHPGAATLTTRSDGRATVAVPADAQPGETISIILQGTDDGEFPLTRYDRVVIRIV
ncbi:hypothetical protein [Actinoplanes nipponensis]|uniref:hypothetical protein n=1 Tax=Actinoplanes nipponensis TaxID=135950 RepID=UPI0031E5AA5E